VGITAISILNINSQYLFDRDANIGEAIRSPTIKADDRTPSSKLFNLKSPLHKSTKLYCHEILLNKPENLVSHIKVINCHGMKHEQKLKQTYTKVINCIAKKHY
jgi:hypothetical protein